MAIEIYRIESQVLGAQMNAHAALLQDAVHSGASIGFLPPLDVITAVSYWHNVIAGMDEGSVAMVAAYDGQALLGSVQLGLEMRANGSHRAEVKKLMVHTTARRMGIGAALMKAAEDEARSMGRSLLVLDTRKGDASEALYRKLGYMEAGEIPRYARSASGELHTTVFFYKELA